MDDILAADLEALREMELEQERAFAAGQSDILTSAPINPGGRRPLTIFADDDDDDETEPPNPVTATPNITPPSSSPPHFTSPLSRARAMGQPSRVKPITSSQTHTQMTALSLPDSSDDEEVPLVWTSRTATSSAALPANVNVEAGSKRTADGALPGDQLRSKKLAIDSSESNPLASKPQPLQPTSNALSPFAGPSNHQQSNTPQIVGSQARASLLFLDESDDEELLKYPTTPPRTAPPTTYSTTTFRKSITPITTRTVGTSKSFQLHDEKTGKTTTEPFKSFTRNYTVRPATGDSLPACSSTGKRLYFPLKRTSPAVTQSNILTPTTMYETRGFLLGKSIHKMMDEVEQESVQKAREDSVREEYAKLGEVVNFDPMVEDEEVEEGQGEGVERELWVDKYRPRLYVDLVGDERINRDVLNWVKEWDHCVFKKKVKKKERSKVKTPSWKTENKGFQKENTDPYHRPEKKILLLAGPPGLGKTTLAQVVAHHAGYNIVEINASDDRTGESLKNKLQGALESQSVMGNKKPSLVVIDEIDGASSGGHGEQNFMKLLLDVVNGDSEARVLKDRGQSKKVKGKPPLRPIICICNDL
ncbi:Chromosome transmission fidelity protein 18, partial [Rhizophlyctis rosea]